eukprot:1194329-Prorocentrum_minimum.AAC.1
MEPQNKRLSDKKSTVSKNSPLSSPLPPMNPPPPPTEGLESMSSRCWYVFTSNFTTEGIIRVAL